MRKILAIAAIGLSLVAFGTPATAQVAERGAVIAACSVANPGAECRAALAEFLRVVETLPASARRNSMADIINVLAATATPENRELFSELIEVVAVQSGDATLREAALEIAAQVATGEEITTVIAAQGSPN